MSARVAAQGRPACPARSRFSLGKVNRDSRCPRSASKTSPRGLTPTAASPGNIRQGALRLSCRAALSYVKWYECVLQAPGVILSTSADHQTGVCGGGHLSKPCAWLPPACRCHHRLNALSGVFFTQSSRRVRGGGSAAAASASGWPLDIGDYCLLRKPPNCACRFRVVRIASLMLEGMVLSGA